MDRLPGTVAPASLVASPSYARAVLPAARAVLTTLHTHTIEYAVTTLLLSVRRSGEKRALVTNPPEGGQGGRTLTPPKYGNVTGGQPHPVGLFIASKKLEPVIPLPA